MYQDLGISEDVVRLVEEAEKDCQEEFTKLEKNGYLNSLKVLSSFHKNEITESCFNATTGYGYNDVGRDGIEAVFRDVLGAEKALVRSQFISGSHALNVCFFALLRPGDLLLSISGKPYDTLDQVIGLEENPSSLTLRINSSISGCKRGSPPVTHTPSRIPWRFFRNAKISSSGILFFASTCVTSDALWQKGHLKLHPAVKIVHATFAG